MTKQDSNLNAQDEVRIRPLEPRDRSPIERMVISSGKFNDVEIATALELVEEALEEGEESGYLFAVLERGEKHDTVLGYACYGPVPLTHWGLRPVLDRGRSGIPGEKVWSAPD